MRQCPRCASEITPNDKVCPRCGLPVSKIGEAEEKFADEMEKQAESNNLNSAQKSEKRRLARKARKEAKRQRKLEAEQSKTDFSKFASNYEGEDKVSVTGKKRKKRDPLQFDIDENGEFNIDTKDVEIIGEETAKILEEKRQQSYSVKKARGDYRQPKIKWWEIYKLADRSFARRKIKKEVSKAAKVRPENISKTKLLLFAIFFGWFGLHNFYAKNKRKGWVSVVCLLISILGLALEDVQFFRTFETWIVGFNGFVVLFIWITDVVNILFNTFKYRIQRDKFIAGLNIETRAKLGEKYIDLELLHKPWPVRLKVWWQKKRRNYAEWKHDRRQALIEREKEKQQKQEENDKIQREIAEFERKEDEKIKEEKVAKKRAKEVEVPVVEEQPKAYSQQKKAKISINTKSNKNKSKKK